LTWSRETSKYAHKPNASALHRRLYQRAFYLQLKSDKETNLLDFVSYFLTLPNHSLSSNGDSSHMKNRLFICLSDFLIYVHLLV